MKYRSVVLVAAAAIAIGAGLLAQGRGSSLLGKNSYQPDDYRYCWRVVATTDEYFDYYRDYHAFWKWYGMGLGDDVLKKLYYKNPVKLAPGLPADRFPS
jgi:hypothetical protein